MLRFKTFINEQQAAEHVGYTADLYLHPTEKPIVYIYKKGVPLDEAAKDWSLPTVTSTDPNDPTKTGRIRELTKDKIKLPSDHHLKAFSEFKPTNLNDHEKTMEEFHKHLAAHGLYSATDKHPMHKTPHMQKFEDGVHDILGGGKHERWHTDSTGALGSPGSAAARDAAVYSSSHASTHVGKITGYDDKKKPIVEPLKPGTKPGTVHIFDDYGEKIPGTNQGDSQHKAPSREERGDRHFIRASDIRAIPEKGIPKKGGSHYDHNTPEGIADYIKDKTPSNEKNNMHNKLRVKIGKWISDNPNPAEGSVNHKKRQNLLAHINSETNRSHYNHDGWVEKHMKNVDSKAKT
jgi:hypothetical protein